MVETVSAMLLIAVVCIVLGIGLGIVCIDRSLN